MRKVLLLALLTVSACKCSGGGNPLSGQKVAEDEHLALNAPDAGAAYEEPLTAEQRARLRECVTAYFKQIELNEFGDPADTEYETGSPLKDPTGREIPFEEYIFVHNLAALEQCPVIRARRAAAPEGTATPPPYASNLSPDEVKQIDDCIRAEFVKQGLNEFGDPKETAYEGGTPLKSRDGNAVLLREYVFVHRPDITTKCPGPTRGSGSGNERVGPDAGSASSKPPYPDLTPEQFASIDACIKQELVKAGLNEFGDPPDTSYDGGSPLPQLAEGVFLPAREYVFSHHPEIIAKCPAPADAPKADKTFDGPKDAKSPYPDHLEPSQVKAIDDCLRAEFKKLGLNEFGDPVGTKYPQNTPLVKAGAQAAAPAGADQAKAAPVEASVPLREYTFLRRPEVVARCPAPALPAAPEPKPAANEPAKPAKPATKAPAKAPETKAAPAK